MEITRSVASGPIERRRLSDGVRLRIEQLISSGELAPGDVVPSERELMRRFGVGRPAVREALYALQRMGLLALISGTRPRVTTPTADRLIFELSGAVRHFLASEEGERAFQDARMFFEAGLARHAALHATDSDLRRLEEALAANEAALGDLAEFQRTDVAFHMQLMLEPNPIFKAIHDAIEVWLVRQRTQSLVIPGAAEAALRSHKKIFGGIADRDPDAAEDAMHDHLQSVAEFYWQSQHGSARASRQRPRFTRND